MNKKYRYGILFTVLAISVLLAGCVEKPGETPGGAAGEIKIGVVAPVTGGASTTGTDMWQAAVLAADEINAKGGVSVNGANMKVQLIKGDTETSREGGVKAVTKLITVDKVDILIGGLPEHWRYIILGT